MWRALHRSAANTNSLAATCIARNNNTTAIRALTSAGPAAAASRRSFAFLPSALAQRLAAFRRAMSSHQSPPHADNAVAITPGETTGTSADVAAPASAAAAASEESAASFESAATAEEAPKPKRPVVYRPFNPTREWQVIEEDHLLPPGLQIRFDFDTDVKYARLQPDPNAPPPPQQQQQPPAAEEQTEAKGDNDAAAAPATDAAAPVGDEAAAAAAAAKVPHAKSSAKSNPKAPKVPKGSRGMSTGGANVVNSSARRPVVLPSFPTPTPEFLAARALLPPRPSPSRPVISVAPMVDVTDKHFRYMMRLISKHILLYTPMIVDNALARAPHAHALYTEHRACEHPLVAQLGGFEAEGLARAAQRCEQQGFQGININVGCPAPSAIGHKYGACLMSDPAFPSAVKQVVQAVSIPVTIKCRIGLNKDDSWEFFENFIRQCVEVGGVRHFIVHARKAILNLKSAGKNLTIPQLNYDFVYRLKKEYPELIVELNGGVNDLDAAEQHIAQGGVDGVMFGRLAWKQPYVFSEVDRRFYGSTDVPLTRVQVTEQYLEYVEEEWERNQREMAEFERRNKAALASTATATQEEGQAAAAAVSSSNGGADPLVAEAVQVDAAASARAHAADRTAASAESEAAPGLRHGVSLVDQLAPQPLDARTLLKPIGYLYTHEPGYKRFRLLFEEGLLRHKEWSLRHIVERAMSAVEPPPPRQWGEKDPGFDYSPAAKAEMEAARAALAAGGPAAAARAASQGKPHPPAPALPDEAAQLTTKLSMAAIDGEAQCGGAAPL